MITEAYIDVSKKAQRLLESLPKEAVKNILHDSGLIAATFQNEWKKSNKYAYTEFTQQIKERYFRIGIEYEMKPKKHNIVLLTKIEEIEVDDYLDSIIKARKILDTIPENLKPKMK